MKAIKNKALLLVLGLFVGVLCVLGVSACAKKPNNNGLYYGSYYLNGMDDYENDTEGTYKYSYLEILDDDELEFHNVNFSRIDPNIYWAESPILESLEYEIDVTQRLLGIKPYQYDAKLKVLSITIVETEEGILTLDFEYNGVNELKLSQGDISFTFILK